MTETGRQERMRSGGAAAAGGMDFQHSVAAWVAVHILAERDVEPPWELPSEMTLEWLRCETEHPVDDLLVGTSAGGLVFAQIKRTLRLSKREDSDLASALDQFVRQYILQREKVSRTQPWDRPLDPARDRLVLITSSRSSEPIRTHLREILKRSRNPSTSESLEAVALNKDERRALSVVRDHIASSWSKTAGTHPSDDELRELFALLHIQVLDIDEGFDEEREAKNLLRMAVLEDPDQADVAWAEIIRQCARFSSERSGSDRIGLQRSLLNAGIKLKVVRSYRQDIERLKRYSDTTFNALAHLAQIRVGEAKIKIRRPSTDVLCQVAEEGSILVVGEPGAGKSGALHDLVKALREGGRDCVFLAVDRFAARSLGELREEIGLTHELVEVLDNWLGDQPAFLVIDALDAARGEPASKMIRELVRNVVEKGSRWRVVASIRKFDLRYGEELRRLFAGSPLTSYLDPEFANVRHLNIPPRFSDEELAQIAPQCAELDALLQSASAELHDLLRVPFNLRLMAELLGGGVALEELTPIKTQLELLDRYWKWRVIRDDSQGDAREAVLREACENMVSDRELRISRSRIARPGTSAPLNDLLSTQVLIEWQPSPQTVPDRYVLAFAHHVLFDYAVARLLLRGTPDALVRRLENDRELAVVIRPSLVLHFHHLWTVDESRRQFWDVAFRIILSDQIPEVAKLIGPAVAAELARTPSDLEPLCAALESANKQLRASAERALRHLIGALIARVPDAPPLAGPDGGPWCDLLERVSRAFRPSTAYAARILLVTLCERPELLTPAQRSAAGQTARRLLEFAWSQELRDGRLVVHALQCVCRTFESDPAASAALIQRCLEPGHLAQHGFEEMPWLAREVKRLVSLDPGLVEEIYRVAFSYQETSEEPTPMGTGRILQLVSNRRQDYGMALYQLAETFPVFLEQAPEEATRALIAVMEAYVIQRHPTTSSQEHEETFDFDGRPARLRTDYSAIWDGSNVYRHDESLKMLDTFQQYLEELANQQEAAQTVRKLVEILVSENRLAVFWRRLLLIGARFPTTVGRELLPLTWAIPILTGWDTTTPAGKFLKVIFPTLDRSKRERVERTIISIPEQAPVEHREAAERIRNRLLGCLPEDELVTEEARQLLEELAAGNAIPPNEPLVRFEGPFSEPYGEEEYLRDQGVPVEAEPNRRIRELERPVRAFADKHLNSTPTVEEIKDAISALKALREALSRAEVDGVHPKQAEHTWDSLAAACTCIARIVRIPCDQDLGAFVKDVLLEASYHPKPAYDSRYNAQFDEGPSWGRPAPRVQAAEGLIVLARNPSCATPDVLKAIGHLSRDPVLAVRFQIARCLNALYSSAPDQMWKIIERMCREETSRGVLQGLLSGPLARLSGTDPDHVSTLTKTIFDRVREGPGAKKVRELCTGIFTDLYVWRDQAVSRNVVLEIVSDPAAYPDEAYHVLARLREPITYGPTDPPNQQADAVRQRALDLLQRLLRSCRDGLRQLEEQHPGAQFDAWPQEDREKAKSLARLIDRIGAEVYFASGAYDTRRQGKSDSTRSLRPEARRFYQEAATILDELADVGLPSVTHHIVETLEFFIPLDPRGVFLRIARVVRAGQRSGYQYESLAADLIVKLVERYLAEYRHVLREDTECRQALIEILDLFVQAGWPSARRLTYRLEEIFR